MIRHVVARRTGPGYPPIEPPTPRQGTRLGVEACFRYCEALARAHHHIFPVASRFVPANLRPHIFALYAFARAADDFVDEPEYEGKRDEELDRWDDLLHRCFHGEADHPIFIALSETQGRFDLPITPFQDLLAAFRMDLQVKRYATWPDLLAYANLSARPVGDLVLYVLGDRDPHHHRFAADLTSALALTSCWQDISRDLTRGRVYLPQEDLRHFGVTEDDLLAQRQTPGLTALFRYECLRTRALFARSRPLIDQVGDDFGVELAMIWHGGVRALAKLEKNAHRVFRRKQRFDVVDKAYVVTRALALRRTSALNRLLGR